MTYDDWKTETPEDEAARRIRARRIECDDCGDRFATIWCEDLTGYDPEGGQWLCDRCVEEPSRAGHEPNYDAPTAAEMAHRQAEAMRLKR